MRTVLLQMVFFSTLILGADSYAQSSADEHLLASFYSEVPRYSQSMPVAALESRLRLYAQKFVHEKSPYLVDPLGEGVSSEVSPGPLYRFDGFDCTTFVETVVALAISSSPEEFRQRINQIRYKNGEVSYQTRNHFPSIDWIPNNTEAGFVADITGKVAGSRTRWSQTWIEKGEWLRRKGARFAPLAGHFRTELGRIPYIGKEDLLEVPALLERIPSGVIFHVVRPNWNLKKSIGTQLDVSHMGFLIREKGLLYMVHASNGASRDGSDDSRRVKKELLRDYVERVMMKSPSTAGINILEIRTP